MLREQLESRGWTKEKDFHWRGGEITRLEGFSDAVFAFAVTLLVVSLEVPDTFDELLHAMRGFVAFGICFTILISLWYEHYIYVLAYRRRDLLQLDAVETFHTRSAIHRHLIHIAVAVSSLCLAQLGGPRSTAWAGWVYALLGPAHTIYGIRRGKRLQKLKAAKAA